MEIESSSLWREVQAIISSGQGDNHWAIDVVLHAVNQKSNVKVMKILELDRLRDFTGRYTDAIVLRLAMFKGDYAYQVFPFRDNLEATLIFTPLTETGQPDTRRLTKTVRYNAILRNEENLLLKTDSNYVPTQEVMNREGPYGVVLQLQDKAVSLLEKYLVGTTFKSGTTVEQALQVMYYTASNTALSPIKQLVDGVDVVTPNNTQPQEHIILPQGTRLVDVAGYIQDVSYGIYNAGIGSYYANKHWYIYPLYDTTRIKNTKRIVTIINIPENKLPGIERTYRQNGSNLVILATGNTNFADSKKATQLNEGTGVRFADANAVMSKSAVTTQKNLAVLQSNQIMNQVTLDEPTDGRSFAPLADVKFTSNKCRELSKLAKRSGFVASLTWEHSMAELIEPGTVAKLLYIAGETVRQVNATILAIHETSGVLGDGVATKRMIPRAIVTLFITDAKTDSATS